MSTYVPPSTVVESLKRYLTPVDQLSYGEYEYSVVLGLMVTVSKKGGRLHTKFKYDTDPHFYKILSALLNTSGGIIRLLPRIPEKGLNDKDFDEWRNGLKDRLHFIPEDIYLQCISMHIEDGQIYILVHKAKQFITTDAHVHTRGTSENYQPVHFQYLSKIVTQQLSNRTPTDLLLLITGPIRCMQKCHYIESKNLEFKFYQYLGESTLIERLANDRGLKTIFGMANLDNGGCIVFGIKEDVYSKENMYIGQELEKHREVPFKTQFANLMTYNKDGIKRIWGDPQTTPSEGKQWSCQFVPVGKPPYLCKTRCNLCPHKARRVLIVVHIYHCPGGMFERIPEAFTVNDDGFIEKFSFDEWKRMHIRGATTLDRTTETDILKESSNTIPKMPISNVVFKDNTAISYSKHSSRWIMHRQSQQHTVDSHREISYLFKVDYPVRYTPDRQVIHNFLQDAGILLKVDACVDRPAFGIVADTLLTSIVHTCTHSQLMKYAQSTLTTSKKMDMLVVDEVATITLFVWNSQVDQKSIKERSAYGKLFARIIKKRILEHMDHDSSTAIRVNVNIFTQSSIEACSPQFYQEWFRASNVEFRKVCSALGSALTNIETCFRNVIIKHTEAELSKHQMETLVGIDINKYNIIEGPPGSGKTLLAQHICRKLHQEENGSSAYISASMALNNRMTAKHPITVGLAKTSRDIVDLLRKDLKDINHIVIDDNHNIVYREDDLHDICDLIRARQKRRMYLFQDSIYQQYQKQSQSVSFKHFIVDNAHLYGTISIKQLNEIRRNTQVVGSFIKSQITKLVPNAKSNEVKCLSSLEGDDIEIKHVKDLRSETETNGLLKHVRQLISTSVDARERQYTMRDIAILFDDKHIEVAEGEITFYKALFRKFWPQAKLQTAEQVPVQGMIMDRIDNFMGLESRVVIFIMPTQDRFPDRSVESQLSNTRYKVAIASRGTDRVDFLQAGNLEGQHVEAMDCDTCSSSDIAFVTNPKKSDHAKSEKLLQFKESETQQVSEAKGETQQQKDISAHTQTQQTSTSAAVPDPPQTGILAAQWNYAALLDDDDDYTDTPDEYLDAPDEYLDDHDAYMDYDDMDYIDVGDNDGDYDEY